MNQKESRLAKVTKLLEEGTLASSNCRLHLLQALKPLLDARVLVEEISGCGRRLAVRNEAALRQFIQREFPDVEMGRDESSRASGVARFRDSKTFASNTPEIISVKAWAEEALLKDGQPVGCVRASSEHGVFSFMLTKNYFLRGPCALVENPVVFAQFDRLNLPVGLVIRSGAGYVSQRLMDWLAANDTPDFSLLHLPDYDPVGLTEFTRLRARLGRRVSLHLPDDLAWRFRFSKRSILEKGNNRDMLAKLRKTKLAEVRRVVELIDLNNACLEQEALLLANETN